MSDSRQHLHELIDRLAPEQVDAIARAVHAILDPAAIMNAPVDDEPVTEEDRQRVAAGPAWFEEHDGKGIPMEEILAQFGLRPEDFPAPTENHQ